MDSILSFNRFNLTSLASMFTRGSVTKGKHVADIDREDFRKRILVADIDRESRYRLNLIGLLVFIFILLDTWCGVYGSQ